MSRDQKKESQSRVERESDTSALEKSSSSDEATFSVISEDSDDLFSIPLCERQRRLVILASFDLQKEDAFLAVSTLKNPRVIPAVRHSTASRVLKIPE